MCSYLFPLTYLGCEGSKYFQNAWWSLSNPISCMMKKSHCLRLARYFATSRRVRVISKSSFLMASLSSVRKVTSNP